MQTTIKTNSKQFLTHVNAYILEAIDTDGYDLDKQPETEAEKLQFLAEQFKREVNVPYELKKWGNYQTVFSQWLAGIPSCFNVDFANYRIIEIAKEWGSLAQDATEKQEDKVLSNWYNLIAFKTMRLCQRHNISLF